MKELLFNPFKRIAGVKALLAGLGVLFVSALLASLYGLRYDGAIDAHFVPNGQKVSFLTSIVEQLVNILCISIFLYVSTLITGAKNTRPIDMVGTISLARFPYMFIPLLNIGSFFSRLSESILNISNEEDALAVLQDSNIIWLLVLSIPLIALVVWTIALFVNAYKVSTNLKGSKMVVSFIVGLLVAEIVSILIIRSFL
jgi:hypothetical protein